MGKLVLVGGCSGSVIQQVGGVRRTVTAQAHEAAAAAACTRETPWFCGPSAFFLISRSRPTANAEDPCGPQGRLGTSLSETFPMPPSDSI